MFTDRKIILCGSTVHYYQFSKLILYGNPSKPKTRQRTKNNNRREDNIYRTKKSIRHILQANAYQYNNNSGKAIPPMFYTLTFAESGRDLKQSNLELKRFILRLNHYFGRSFRYLAVPEIQYHRESKYGVGVWHYHIIFFDLPYNPDIYGIFLRLWDLGSVYVKTVKNLLHLTRYVSKYISKECADTRLIGEKAYFCSRNLKRPQTIYNPQAVNLLSTVLKNPVFQKEYNSFDAKIIYKVFTINPKVVENSFDTILKFSILNL